MENFILVSFLKIQYSVLLKGYVRLVDLIHIPLQLIYYKMALKQYAITCCTHSILYNRWGSLKSSNVCNVCNCKCTQDNNVCIAWVSGGLNLRSHCGLFIIYSYIVLSWQSQCLPQKPW